MFVKNRALALLLYFDQSFVIENNLYIQEMLKCYGCSDFC